MYHSPQYVGRIQIRFNAKFPQWTHTPNAFKGLAFKRGHLQLSVYCCTADLDYIETFPSTHSSSNHSLLAWSPQITSTLIACSSYSHIFKSMTWSPSLLLVAPFSRQRSQDFTADSSSDSIKQSAIPRCVTMVPPLYILLSLTFCQQRSYHPLPRCLLIPICHYMSVA